MSPVQHFMWECLNDKFVKDNEIWNRVLRRVPHSMSISQRKWGKTLKAMRPTQNKQNNLLKKKEKRKEPERHSVSDDEKQLVEERQSTETPKSPRSVVVMDFSTTNVASPDFLRFADVVTFLVGSNSPNMQCFGEKPEVILILQSPGGEVTCTWLKRTNLSAMGHINRSCNART